MTLREIIETRKNKYEPFASDCSCSDTHKGYMAGWKWAYQDLKEILEQNGFNMDVEVIKEKVI